MYNSLCRHISYRYCERYCQPQIRMAAALRRSASSVWPAQIPRSRAQLSLLARSLCSSSSTNIDYNIDNNNGNIDNIDNNNNSNNSNSNSTTTLTSCSSIAGDEHTLTLNCANDQKMVFKTGRLAKFADGAAVVQMGDTSVLVTAVSSKKRAQLGYLPLMVDYRQKAAAAGRIPTNYLRREIGPTDQDILTGRTIDRSIRPLFPAGYPFETQLTCNLLAVDGQHDPDILAINAASVALCLSDIPFAGPVGAVRVGLVDGEAIVHPTRAQMSTSTLNLIVSGVEGSKVVMLEAGAQDVPVQDMMKAIKTGMKEVTQIVLAIQKFAARFGKPKREFVDAAQSRPEGLVEAAERESLEQIMNIMLDWSHDKFSRDEALAQVRQAARDKLASEFPDTKSEVLEEVINGVVKTAFRNLVLEKGERMDGRQMTDVRKIFCDVDILAPLHGSALFQRGQTQVMCTVAFDSPHSALQLKDPVSQLLEGAKAKNFILHYEFPQYATNDIGSNFRVGRRELGHGNLAEKALKPVVPKDFPFTIRLTSEVLESNGSSSMATVCGGTLALLDAGVELLHPVAGVAMGIVTEPDPDNPKQPKNYRILTDILGIEDYLGEMDFKMAGTSRGLTALQADMKIAGLPIKIIMETIVQGYGAKTMILKAMNETIQKARCVRKDNWPVVEKFEVPAHKRPQFVGVGGLNLKRITAETGVTLCPIDDTSFDVFAPNQTAMSEAKELMMSILMSSEREPALDFGGVYTARIVELRDAGVMVQLYPTMHPTLLPNSQLDQRRVSHPSALGLEEGQEIQVKYYGRDPVSGTMRLSRKVLQAPPSSIMKNLMKK